MNKATGKWPASFVLHFTWILSYSVEIKKAFICPQEANAEM